MPRRGRHRLLLCLGLAWLAGGGLAWGAAPMPASALWPPPLAEPTAHDRVLIIAPHCDDEVLATGGLIQHALAAGAQLQVVILTNGDGFRSAAQRLAGRKRVSPAEFIGLGLRRQRESLAALALLGVSARQVIFLGYPDAGLERMWVENWALDHPYTSRPTGQHASPYPNSFRRDAPYAGRAVVDDLKTILARFRPTLLVLPHPGDRHPDHGAAYAFATAAVYELGWQTQVRTLCYLLHKAAWSEPPGPHDGPILAPPDRTDAWSALSLTPSQLAGLRQAGRCYRTQLAVLLPFMRRFLVPKQFFAAVPWRELGSSISGAPSITAAFDTAYPSAGPRVKTLRAARDGAHLRLSLELTAPLGTGSSCRVYLHPLTPARVEAPQQFVLYPVRPADGLRVTAKGLLLEALLPCEKGAAGVILAADVRTPDQRARTRWIVLVGH